MLIAMPLRALATCSNSATRRGSAPAVSDGALVRSHRPAPSGRAASSASSAVFSASISFCCRARAASACFQVCCDGVGFEHAFEHLLFDLAELALRGRHLVLYGLVFAVRFDFWELVFELGETALENGGVLLECAARLLVVFQALPRRCDALLCRVEPRVGFGKTLRMRGDLPPRVLDRVVELVGAVTRLSRSGVMCM